MLCAACLAGRAAENEPVPGPPTTPAPAVDLHPAAGLTASLFTNGPSQRQWIAHDVDHRGRVWVLERARPTEPAGGRSSPAAAACSVRLFGDLDGDGKAEREATFCEDKELSGASGVSVLGDRLLIAAAPNLVWLTDTNGDNRADGPPAVLLSGLGVAGQPGSLSTAVFGPDGRLYFTVAALSAPVRRGDGSTPTNRLGRPVLLGPRDCPNGGLLRCNLEGNEVELVSANFCQPAGVAVDSLGGLWVADPLVGATPSTRLIEVIEGADYGCSGAGEARTLPAPTAAAKTLSPRPPLGAGPTLLALDVSTVAGLRLYEGQLLPEVYRHQLLLCDPASGSVRAVPTAAARAVDQTNLTDLLRPGGEPFRPLTLAVASDGSLFVCGDARAAVSAGSNPAVAGTGWVSQIYRLAPDATKYTVPRSSFTNRDDYVSALLSPNQSQRYRGWRVIAGSWPQGLPQRLVNVLRDNPDPYLQARALNLLCRIGPFETNNVAFGLRSTNADLRVAAVRILRWRQHDPVPPLGEVIEDPAPAVRRECALALRDCRSPAAAKLWTTLARQYDGRDAAYLEALGLGAEGQWDAFLGAWLAEVGEAWRTPAGREIVARSRAQQSPGLLLKLILDRETPAADRERFRQTLAALSGPERNAAIQELSKPESVQPK